LEIDNDIYNRLGETWWDADNPLVMLHGSVTSGRFAYFVDVLKRQIGEFGPGMRALDIGSGAGFLAEEFARLGFLVSGIDPSPIAVETARRHAGESGLAIEYQIGGGESLPFDDESSDLVYCCDVLEHVSDLDRVIAETARVLQPGGIYLFDTVNRTWISKIIAIEVIQDWKLTGVLDKNGHVWSMFIKPAELAVLLKNHGLRPAEVVGLNARANPVSLVSNYARAKRGKITYLELSERMKVGQVRNKAVSYMGYALKP